MVILGTRFGLKDANGQGWPNPPRDSTMSQNLDLAKILAWLAAHPENALILLGVEPGSDTLRRFLTFSGIPQSNTHLLARVEAFAEFLDRREPTPTPSRMKGRLVVYGDPFELNTFAWGVLDGARDAQHKIKTEYTREKAIRATECRVIKFKDNVLHF